MKLKLHPLVITIGLFTFAGCGIITPLPSNTYAELRLEDNGKKQLLIETDEWRGMITAEGYQGNKHWTQAWFDLQGDGPVYNLKEDTGQGDTRISTITIDRLRKHVTIDTWYVSTDRSKKAPLDAIQGSSAPHNAIGENATEADALRNLVSEGTTIGIAGSNGYSGSNLHSVYHPENGYYTLDSNMANFSGASGGDGSSGTSVTTRNALIQLIETGGSTGCCPPKNR